ncbi:MAG: DUF433 domain-containing protein [Candidatus Sericytochromatia bacterium]|nr:DUF433 domain-containing protein [Candidatus Tanganyikabacteria bacterium]
MDKRELPNYQIAEAAWALGLPPTTVRRWVGRKGKVGIVVPAQDEPPALSFFNLAELYVLASVRRLQGVPLESVRRALATLERLAAGPHPLISQEFLTDGVSLFTKAYGDLTNLSRSGQIALAELLEASLRRVDRDDRGKPIRLYPWRSRPDEPKHLVLDPAVSFGRLAIAGTGVPVDVLTEFWRAGDPTSRIAAGYRLDPGLVEEAVRWGTQKAAA